MPSSGLRSRGVASLSHSRPDDRSFTVPWGTNGDRYMSDITCTLGVEISALENAITMLSMEASDSSWSKRQRNKMLKSAKDLQNIMDDLNSTIEDSPLAHAI